MKVRRFVSTGLSVILLTMQLVAPLGRAFAATPAAAPRPQERSNEQGQARAPSHPVEIGDDLAPSRPPPAAGVPLALAQVPLGTGNSNFGQQQRDTDNPQNHPAHHFAGSVNLLNGNLFLTVGDFFIPGRGLSLQLARSYNSLAAAQGLSGAFGPGWTHSYETRVISDTAGASLTVLEADGALHVYQQTGVCPDSTGDVCYTSPPGFYQELRHQAGGTFLLTHKNGTQQTFDEQGRLDAIVDRHGNQINLLYEDDGACTVASPPGVLCRVDDPSGLRALEFTYTESPGGPVVSTITEDLDGTPGRSITYTYDAAGNLADVGYPEEPAETTNYVYDADHRMTAYDDPRQPAGVRQAQEILYDATDRVTKVTHYVDSFFDVFYEIDYNPPAPEGDGDGDGWLSMPGQNPVGAVEISDGEGQTSRVEYDANGNVTWEGDLFPEYGWWWGKWWWWHPTTWWLLSRKVDANDNETLYAYDAWGNTEVVTNAIGGVQHFLWEPPAYESTDPTAPTYGNVISATNSLGVTTLYQHDYEANALIEIRARGESEETQTVYQSDQYGQLVLQNDSLGRATAYEYDAWGNMTVITDATGAVTRNRYDAVGRPVVTVDQAGNETIYVYDASDRLLSVTDPADGTTAYTYSPDGRDNLVALTNANGATTTYAYDALDRLMTETNALGEFTTYDYDNLNRLTERTDANGRVTAYSYDAKSRMRRAEYWESGATAPYRTNLYTYDGAGNLVAMSNEDVRLAYAYDALDQRERIDMWTPTWEVTRTLTLDREDPAGNLTQVTGPEGYQLLYAYDDLNRVRQVTDPAGGATSYQYDPGGRPTNIAYADGTVATYSYDPMNRLTGLGYATGDGEDLAYTYTYDSRGNLTNEMDLGEVYTYTYDAVGRVVTSTGEAEGATGYSYDPVGNRLSADTSETATSFSYDAVNRLLQAGDATFGYDAMGARTQVDRTAAPAAAATAPGGGIGGTPTSFDPAAPAQPSATVSYAYDNDMRLIEVQDGTQVHRYIYDPLGNLIGYVDADGGYHYYLRDGEDIYLELNGAGAVIATYTLGAQGVVSMWRGGVRYLFLYDGRGRVRHVIDLATAAIVHRYGRALLSLGYGLPGFYNPIRIRGAWWFPGVYLVHFGGGVFWDPWFGVFLAKAWPWLYWPFGPFHPWRPIFRFWPWPWPWPRPWGWPWPRPWGFLWPWPGAWVRPWLIWPIWPWGLRFWWPWWYWRWWWGWTWWGRWWCWHPWWWWGKWWWWPWWHPWWWWPYWWWPWWWWTPCWWWPWHWWWWIWWAPWWWFWWPGRFWWCWWWWWPWPWWWWMWWWPPAIGPPPDYGDAPDPPYASYARSGGAIHGWWWYEWLGANRDGEWDSEQIDRDLYDDGVSTDAVAGTVTFTPTVAYPTWPARYSAAAQIHVHGWVDWNSDGDWTDTGEMVVNWSDYPGRPGGPWPAGRQSLRVTEPFAVPAIAFSGSDVVDLWMRFRLDYAANWESPTGYTTFGEVEDHMLTVVRARPPAWNGLVVPLNYAPVITYPTAVSGVQVSIQPSVPITPVWTTVTRLAAGTGNTLRIEHTPFTVGQTYTITLSGGTTSAGGYVTPASFTLTAGKAHILMPLVMRDFSTP